MPVTKDGPDDATMLRRLADWIDEHNSAVETAMLVFCDFRWREDGDEWVPRACVNVTEHPET